MRNIGTWLVILVCGWVLGWYSHEHWSAPATPASSSDMVSITPENNTQAIELPIFVAPKKETNEPVGNEPAPPDDIEPLLTSGQFEDAVERYSALRSQHDEATSQRYRIQILQHAIALKQRERYSAAAKLLDVYLNHEYRDVEALKVLAEVHHLQRNYRAEIDVLYEAKAHAYRTNELEQVTTRIHSVAAEYASFLRSHNDDQALLELYQFLTRIEPDYSPYFMGMAEAQLALEDFEGAQLSLSLIVYDPTVGKKAAQLLENIEGIDNSGKVPEETTTIAIPLTRINDQFLVEAWIGNNVRATLLIDTGASLTIIDPGVLERAGVKYNKSQPLKLFNTANGRVKAPVFTIDALTLGDQTVRQIQVGGIELSSMSGIDGLLGMNYLRHFQFFIDQFEGVLRLSPRG